MVLVIPEDPRVLEYGASMALTLAKPFNRDGNTMTPLQSHAVCCIAAESRTLWVEFHLKLRADKAVPGAQKRQIVQER